MLRVRNTKTGVESIITDEQYEKTEKSPNTRGMFTILGKATIEPPKEVKVLAQNKATQKVAGKVEKPEKVEKSEKIEKAEKEVNPEISEKNNFSGFQ